VNFCQKEKIMDLQLAGKTAVVTGGSKGTGLAVVRTLLGEGMRVVTGSRRTTPELKETRAVHVPVDLTTAERPSSSTARWSSSAGSTCWSTTWASATPTT
jgi:NAD(P)-dependent dehydrogenase (short-subunit alcohol dehydrogenase family)